MNESQRENDPYANLPQNWTGGQGGPMVVVAPPSAPEPSATRGVTGLFVLVFLAIAMVSAIYFAWGAWQSDQKLRAQQLVSRDSQGIANYMRALSVQNAELCRDAGRDTLAPDRPPVDRPTLVAQIKDYRTTYETECRYAASSAGRDISGLNLSGVRSATPTAGTASCTKAAPAPLSVPDAGKTKAANAAKARELLTTICPRYQGWS